jgi:hypothetical protein
VIGRWVEVIVDLHRVRAVCDGRIVADQLRIWGCIRRSPILSTSPRRRRCA